MGHSPQASIRRKTDKHQAQSRAGHHNRFMPSAPDADQLDSDQPCDNTPQEPDEGNTENDSDAEQVDSGQPGTDTGEGQPFPPRGTLTLRALRWGGLIAAFVSWLVSMKLSVVYGINANTFQTKISQPAAILSIVQVLAWWGAAITYRLQRTATIVILIMVTSIGIACTTMTIQLWRTTYEQSGISFPILLSYAAGELGVAMLMCISVILHRIRSLIPTNSSQRNNPARWRSLYRRADRRIETGKPTSPRYVPLNLPARTKIRLAAVSLIPVITLSLLATGTHYFITPFKHSSISAPSSLPPLPTTIGTSVIWTKEMTDVDQVVAGAAGPIVFSNGGVIALNPANGGTLWEYKSDLSITTAFTSPDRHYLALRAAVPEILERSSDEYDTASTKPEDDTEATLVFNTLTGELVLNHISGGGTLQLTDTAALDHDTIFSLKNGERLQTLDSPIATTYSGPAGHKTFIVDTYSENYDDKPDEHTWDGRASIAVAPETNPSASTQIKDLLIDPIVEDELRSDLDERYIGANPVIVGGWVAQFSGQNDENGHPLAHAINIDDIARGDQTNIKTVPLGSASGVNRLASVASNTLSTYPYYGTDQQLIDIAYRWQESRVATVFDPATRTATPSSRYPGLAAARTGIESVANGDTVTACIAVKPEDDSPPLTIPIAAGTSDSDPRSLVTGADQLMTQKDDDEQATSFTRSPGVTLITLDTGTQGTKSNTQSSPPRIFRLYGVS